ncbi:MAG: dipeptidase PepE [Euryarchaeota archaeon]|nr:dipeptidase PepE [Euryarchaeota archaeon]
MRVLLGSGGIGTEERRSKYRDLISDHFRDSDNVVFIPLATHDHEGRTARLKESLGPIGAKFHGLNVDHGVEQILAADGVYMGGGNSFLLNRDLHRYGLIDSLRDVVRQGMPYLGVSAGSNVACPTMMTTNDMPIVMPSSYEALGIVPFQINPHYYPGKITFFSEGESNDHFGESRRQRISEYHQHESIPVLGLWEGSYVEWDGARGRLIGRARAFFRDSEPVEFEDGALFDGNLALE